MRRQPKCLHVRVALILAVCAPATLALTGQGLASAQVAVAAKTTVKWTKISKNTGLGIASAGLFRTADGRLHVIWPSHDGLSFSLHYSTMGGRAKLLNSGAVVTKWSGVSAYPRLVAGPNGGLRLVFTGGNGIGGSPFNTGAMYTATSSKAGTSWSLANGSLSQSQLVPLTDTAATTERDGTPVAAWDTNTALTYHVGIDPNIPATSADQTFGIGADGGLITPTLVRTKSGSIVGAWFKGTDKDDQGYYVGQLLPTKQAAVKAPGSGAKNQGNNQNFQPVAFTARSGGGDYLAYCVPTKALNCTHVALWRVGAHKAIPVPGSSSGHAQRVTIAAGPGGHLWVLWFDTDTNRISVVRTNAAATGFGPVTTIPAPPNLFDFSGLQAEGSAGPLDVIALAQQATKNSSPAYFDTQLLPALRIRGSKSSVSNGKATSITFTVTDTGDHVAGATVTFLGTTAKTNAKGVAKFTIKKGTAKGGHVAIATKGGYAGARFTVKVT